MARSYAKSRRSSASRVGFKRMRIPRQPSAAPEAVHRFTRVATTNYQQNNSIGLLSSGTGYPCFAIGANQSDNLQFSFSLEGVTVYQGGVSRFTAPLPNYTEFTALFDTYRIDRIACWCLPTFDSANVTTGGTQSSANLPWLMYAVDYDDVSGTLSTGLMQYGNCKFTQLSGDNSKILRSWIPRSQTAVAAGGVNAGGLRPAKLAWIDTASTNVTHYGLKLAFDNQAGAMTVNQVTGSLNFVFKYWISCKNTR